MINCWKGHCRAVGFCLFVCLLGFFCCCCCFLPTPRGMWDLSPTTRDQTLQWKHRVLTTEPLQQADQWFLKSGPLNTASVSPGSLLEMQILRSNLTYWIKNSVSGTQQCLDKPQPLPCHKSVDQIHTTVYERDKQQGPTVYHRELQSISYNNLQWNRSWKRIYIYERNEVAQSCATFWDPMDCSPTRILHPWNFPGKSGLPFPSPGDLPNTGIEPRSSALQADALPSEPPGRPIYISFIAYISVSFCCTSESL